MLKSLYYGPALLGLGFTVTMASAAPVLVKTTTPGFIMPAVALSTSCTLDDQGFLIKKIQVGNLTAKKVMTQQYNQAALKKVIDGAALGKVRAQVMLPDAGSVAYQAYQWNTTGQFKRVTVHRGSNADSPTTNIANNSLDALTIRNFIDTLCK